MNELEIERVAVRSSCITSVGYDEATRTLEVEFASGAVHRYFDVGGDTHGAFMAAASKGAYFNRHIKARHREARQISPSWRPGR